MAREATAALHSVAELSELEVNELEGVLTAEEEA